VITKRKPFVCLSILLGIAILHGPQFAVGDTIDPSPSEELDPNLRSAIERISPLEHEHIRTKSVTYIKLVQGDIGYIDPEAVSEGDLQSLRELLLAHSELTGAFEQLDLEVVDLRSNRNGQKLFYRQRINGIPVDARSSMVFDANGHVSSLTSHTVDPSLVPAGPEILEAEAIAHALDALMRLAGRNLEDASVSEIPSQQPKLYYGTVGGNNVPELYWRMSVESVSDGLSYGAVVNASTGKTALASNIED
jgi:hypothetical protein